MRQFTISLVSIVCLCIVASLFAGCSSKKSRQAEMMRNAVRRKTGDEDEEEEETPKKNPPPAQKAQQAPAENDVAQNDAGNDSAAGTATGGGESEADSSQSAAPSKTLGVGEIIVNKPAAPLSEEERMEKTVANLLRLHRAFEDFAFEENEYPKAAIYSPNGQAMLSWRVALLDVLGYKELKKKFKQDETWDSPHNLKLLSEIPPVYQSPERFDAKTNYFIASGHTAFHTLKLGGQYNRRDLERGVKKDAIKANTLLVVEVDDELAIPWTKPQNYRKSYLATGRGLGGLRRGGFFALWGKGAVGWVRAEAGTPHLGNMFSLSGGTFPFDQINRPVDEAFAQIGLPAESEVATGGDTTIARVVRPVTSLLPGVTGNTVSPMLKERAQQAFNQRRETEAFQLLYAANLVETNPQWHEQMRWFSALRRPALALRWGTSVHISGTDDNKVEPIGKDAQLRMTDVGQSIQELKNDTGELGLRLVYAARRHVRIAGSETVFEARLDQRNTRNNFDDDDDDDRRRSRNTPRRPQVELILPEDPNAPQFLSTGMSHIGRFPRSTALHLAHKAGIDILAEFSVEIKNAKPKTKSTNNRTRRTTNGSSRSSKRGDNPIYNTTTMTLIDVWSGREILTSAPLNNTHVARVRDDPLSDKDPVDQLFGKVTQLLDSDLKPGELPKGLRPEHARGRVAALCKDSHKYPLPVLTEIRFYFAAGLISRVELEDAYEKILGPDHREFEAQPPSAKLQLIAKWLPAMDQPK